MNHLVECSSLLPGEEMEVAGGGSRQYKRGLWTEEEDKILAEYIEVHGKGHWNRIAKNTGLKRNGTSCRQRWMNYLSPNVKRGNFSEEEDDLIIRLHKLLGNRWSLIAGRVPGRTDSQVKNYWNSHLSKRNGSANRQISESYLPSLDTNSTPELKDSDTVIIMSTENVEQAPLESSNMTGDPWFSREWNTFFANGQDSVTWSDELEHQMSFNEHVWDEFLHYEFGWNNMSALLFE